MMAALAGACAVHGSIDGFVVAGGGINVVLKWEDT